MRKKAEKQFLGYEFSNRRGHEGMHPIQRSKTIDECTSLFEPDTQENPKKASFYVYQNFLGKDFEIDESMQKNIGVIDLVDMMMFDRVDFEKNINLSVKKKIEIESKWEQVKIENLSELIKRGKSAKYGKSKIQIIKSWQARGLKEFDFTEKHFVSENFLLDERKLEEGDLLINSSGVGTAGRVTLFNLKGIFVADSHITIVRLNQSQVLPEYALACFAMIGFKTLESLALGQSGQIEMTIDTIENIKIPLPPRNIQEKIIKEIKEIERKEEKNKKRVEELKDEIGDIIWKIEWKIMILWDICDVRDWTHDSPKFYSEGYPLVTWKNLIDWKIDLHNTKLISESDYKKINQRSVVEKWDVLFWMIWTIGNPVFVNIDPTFAIKNVALFKFSNNSILDWNFFRYLLDSKNIIHQLSHWEKWKTQRFVWLNILRNLKVPLPPFSKQQKIVVQIDKIEKEIESLQAEINNAKRLKEEVLKKYL